MPSAMLKNSIHFLEMITKWSEIFQAKFCIFLTFILWVSEPAVLPGCKHSPVVLPGLPYLGDMMLTMLAGISDFFPLPFCTFQQAHRRSIQCKRYFKQTECEVPSQHTVINETLVIYPKDAASWCNCSQKATAYTGAPAPGLARQFNVLNHKPLSSSVSETLIFLSI